MCALLSIDQGIWRTAQGSDGLWARGDGHLMANTIVWRALHQRVGTVGQWPAFRSQAQFLLPQRGKDMMRRRGRLLVGDCHSCSFYDRPGQRCREPGSWYRLSQMQVAVIGKTRSITILCRTSSARTLAFDATGTAGSIPRMAVPQRQNKQASGR